MINNLQYYISKETNPYKNLAIEKYLFDNVNDDTYILYLWHNQKTAVIGKNQNPWAECNCSKLLENGGSVARRLSGGGAVFHDLGNLNFTFISSSSNMNVEKNLEIIQNACLMAGIDTEISGRNDILVNGRKFSGNAFYNSKNKSYHHGTILINSNAEEIAEYLTPSKAKLEAKGVKSVKSRVINLADISPSLNCEKMKMLMIIAFKDAFEIIPTEIKHIDESHIAADMNMFSSWEFIFGSTVEFSVSFEKHFSWGNANLMLNITEGIINTVRLYTDALDWNLPNTLETILYGCRFAENDIKKALTEKLDVSLAKDFINLIFDN